MKGKKTGGRKKNTPNKTTSQMRRVMAELYENNMDKAQKMLDLVVDPEKWMVLFLKIAEFNTPKQSSVKTDVNIKTSSLAEELKAMENKDE